MYLIYTPINTRSIPAIKYLAHLTGTVVKQNPDLSRGERVNAAQAWELQKQQGYSSVTT